MRAEVLRETKLTCSAGIAANRMLAKVNKFLLYLVVVPMLMVHPPEYRFVLIEISQMGNSRFPEIQRQ
jgi:hypothetical protein